MSFKPNTTAINENIKEYFRFHGYVNTLECFEAEIRAKIVSSKLQNGMIPDLSGKEKEEPRIYSLFTGAEAKTNREMNTEKEMKETKRQFHQIRQAARQIFSVSVSLIEKLNKMKEIQNSPEVSSDLENYKLTLGKYHRLIVNDGKPTGTEKLAESALKGAKEKLLKAFESKNNEEIVDSLLIVRVNGLQISGESKRDLVNDLISLDFFEVQTEEKFSFLLGLLEIPNHQVKRTVLSIVSMITSTVKGVQYIVRDGEVILLQRITEVFKQT